jgi:uncharacterized radical SAM protein YgiQ
MKSPTRNSRFLPTSKKEMDTLGWEQPDIILFTGDAYIDHPSFGAAVIGRLLENAGYKVVIVPQPNWRDDLRDFKKMGAPRLFFAVTSGCMDSMVNHYTANKRLRSNDSYTPEGKAGYRPDYAVKVYSRIIKNLYPEIPLIIGGVEASLRRLTHYDYWADKLFPSILVESGADLLVYGMGEKSILEIAKRLEGGGRIDEINKIPQTAYITNKKSYIDEIESIILHSFDECLMDSQKFGENFKRIEEESNKLQSKQLVEPIGDKLVVVNSPYPPPTTSEMDAWWDLPYMRAPHPRYKGKAIPAWEMIKFSINIHRGCFGGCSFCTISAHQGKFVSSRSEESILQEVKKVISMPDFKGYLSDLGGPSANMYRMQGNDLTVCMSCKKPSCMFPKICSNLNSNHKPLLDLYRKVRSVPGIKKVSVSSGIRYDLFADRTDSTNRQYFDDLLLYHVSGRLKVAPEHTHEDVLKKMRKPPFNFFIKLKTEFESINRKYSLNQQLIPYFISSHPGCTEEHMKSLAEQIKLIKIKPEQVQEFTPTPMTLATTIFYTGVDPYSKKKVYVARSRDQKLNQHKYFFWYQK